MNQVHVWRFKPARWLAMVLLAAALLLGCAVRGEAAVDSGYKVSVMLNLPDITDFNAFDAQLTTLKNYGVKVVEVDMWWNHFEPTTRNQFNWSYYQNVFTHIKNAGLLIAPIFSFHQCGGNVGDNCNFPVPSWVWSLGTQDQMQYKSETGYYNNEYVAPYFTTAYTLYDEAFKSFAANMSAFQGSFYKIYIGLGPAGELRYPSYNAADGWTYPGRGKLQAYSGPAIASFQSAMQAKYSTIGALNSAWGTSLSGFNQVMPPSNGDSFFNTGGYTITYGKDFLTWYQGVLTTHMSNVMAKAHPALDTFGVRLGAKMPGIHWQYNNPSVPHEAENTAGLYNYSTMIDQYKTSNVDLAFTALELQDNAGYPYYSQPQALVQYVAGLCLQKGVPHDAENALAISGNSALYNSAAFNTFNYGFDGFALLRLENVVTPSGAATAELSPFTQALALQPQKVTVTINGANPAAGQSVYLIGDRMEFGAWNTGFAIPATNVGGGVWKATFNLGASHAYSFKAIKKTSSGAVTWENGGNHSWTVPYIAGGTSTYTLNWQN
ncbi:family 14 glycosylhydrolase [Paenibacillus athensensis]|uniref:Beta-amylase n=1 Tax=Paenibacillus athensensis TaxID=1967502 RepID=A0A4Y8Q6Z5_9BACL|nr:family 14 glycosylhydrolase [Paenibacillus athensensis]MCD1257428.1 family 14 glycosylhydrolase [Paenibacillus athensensis]